MIDFEPNEVQLELLRYLAGDEGSYRTVKARWSGDLFILKDGGFIQLSGRMKLMQEGASLVHYYRARISKKGLKALAGSRDAAEGSV